MKIIQLTEKINDAADAYQIGKLQEFRAGLHGWKHPRTYKIFSADTTFGTDGHNYAFHDGGRAELQFNIGVDDGPGNGNYWRHGVAFSFERNQTLSDPTTLQPKVDRFNEWVQTSGHLLDGFKMWDWTSDGRSKDRQPGIIQVPLIEAGAFVFLGAVVPERKVDIHRILRDFDILYPLYQYVESDGLPAKPLIKIPEEVESGSAYSEGGVQQILVNRYERDAKARDNCIKHYGWTCRLCGFDFVALYGNVMKEFIHVHHLKELSKVGSGYKVDPVRDLRPVCPNCHAVLHRRTPAYSLKEARALMNDNMPWPFVLPELT